MGLASWRDPEPVSAFPEALRVIRVPNLNRPEAVAAITAASCDLVCLMGARIINGKTIAALRAPIVNIHSSDPRWVRGGPVVIWEVLDGRDYIQLTIHEVVEALDAGAMLATRAHGIRFSGGIGRTTRHTMRAARPHVADLFAGVIEQWRRDELRRTSFQPGQLRVTPPVSQTLRAELRCRRSLARRTY